ncbi:MAG: hypothetical protein S4CHLAM20_15150 [Chlamydiia bacterium]|nr:hypothetical protein [Chlamydiia bacterium]
MIRTLSFEGIKYTGEDLMSQGLNTNETNRTANGQGKLAALMLRISLKAQEDPIFAALKEKVIQTAKTRLRSFDKALQTFAGTIKPIKNDSDKVIGHTSDSIIGLKKNGEYEVFKKRGFVAFFKKLFSGARFNVVKQQLDGYDKTESFAKTAFKKGQIEEKTKERLNKFDSIKFLFNKLDIDAYSPETPLLKSVARLTSNTAKEYRKFAKENQAHKGSELYNRVKIFKADQTRKLLSK